jgi:UMF1 family MFS transporter
VELFYDWANSVYTLTIASAVFPIFTMLYLQITDHYIDVLGCTLRTTLIGFCDGFAFLVVSFLSPLLSGIADYVGDKKKSFMKFLLFRSTVMYGFVLV